MIVFFYNNFKQNRYLELYSPLSFEKKTKQRETKIIMVIFIIRSDMRKKAIFLRRSNKQFFLSMFRLLQIILIMYVVPSPSKSA